jgi:hypothetical protein
MIATVQRTATVELGPERGSTVTDVSDSRAVRWRQLGREHWLLIAAIIAAVSVRLVYWIMTERTFEDALITVTHSRNVILGLGLTSHYGEGHVQGFTSALSVLIPLAGEVLRPGSGIGTMRVVSLLASGVTMVYAYAIARQLGLNKWATGFVLAYLAFDYNNIFYGMAGMETQVAVAVLLACVYYTMRGDPVRCGLALGTGVLTRPDFLIFFPLALIGLWCHDRRGALKAGALGAMVVAPWIIFTSIYYGSPIPQTIRAKQQSYTEHPPIGHTPGSLWHFVTSQITQHEEEWRYLAPFKESFNVLKAPLSDGSLLAIALVVTLLALIGAWATRRITRWWPVLAYVVLFIIYKTMLLPPTYDEWYLPPCMALIVLLAGAGLTRISTLRRSLQARTDVAEGSQPRVARRRTRPLPAFAAVVSVLLALLFAWQVPTMFPLDGKVQEVENHVRLPLSLYLNKVVQHGEAVSSESAGYVGYYSHALLYDYPGLTSPTAYDALKRLGPSGNNLFYMVQALTPRWLVLRASELPEFRQDVPLTAPKYQIMRQFKWGTPEFSSGGVTYYDGDTDFYVLRRMGPPKPGPLNM